MVKSKDVGKGRVGVVISCIRKFLLESIYGRICKRNKKKTLAWATPLL